MNICRPTVVVVAGLLVSLVSAADSVTKQLEANYAIFVQAIRNKDIRPIDSFLAPEYQVEYKRIAPVKRARVLKDYQFQMTMKEMTWTRKVTGVTRKGDVYLAVVDGEIQATIPGGDNKQHRVKLRATSRDSWTLNGSKWSLHKSEILSRTMSMDGKTGR